MDEKKGIVAIVEKSNLSVEESASLLAVFQGFETVVEKWKKEAYEIVVTNRDQVDLMAKARDGRLVVRDKRISIEKKRKALKEESLRKGQAIDAVARYLKNLIDPIEKHLDEQERFAILEDQRIAAEKAEKERAERQRLDDLEESRKKLSAPYNAFLNPKDLRNITDEEFNKYLDGGKRRKKEDDEEKERIRKENEALRKKVADQEAEKVKLKKQADEKEAKLQTATVKLFSAREQVRVVQTKKNTVIKELREEVAAVKKLVCPKCGHRFEEK